MTQSLKETFKTTKNANPVFLTYASQKTVELLLEGHADVGNIILIHHINAQSALDNWHANTSALQESDANGWSDEQSNTAKKPPLFRCSGR